MMRSRIRQGRYMFAWDNQNMNRRLRVNIGERVALSVLVDRCRRNASLNDFAEETTHNGNSVQEPQLP